VADFCCEFVTVHTYKLLHVMLFISAMALLVTTRQTYEIYQSAAAVKDDPSLTPNQVISGLAKKWRAERTLLSLYSLSRIPADTILLLFENCREIGTLGFDLCREFLDISLLLFQLDVSS
jgi:hypothetical protein